MNEVGRTHKVVVILDQGARLTQGSGEKISVSLKDSTTNDTKEIGSLEKSLWSWTVECAIEFHRIVGDLFHNSSNLVRILIANEKPKYISNWGEELISSKDLLQYLYDVGSADASKAQTYIMDGYKEALLGLCELTQVQKRVKAEQLEKKLRKVRIRQLEDDEEISSDVDVSSLFKNVGSIALFTAFENGEELNNFALLLGETVMEINKLVGTALSEERYHKIDHVYMAIVNTFPKNKKVDLPVHTMKKVHPFVSLTVLNSEADGVVISAAHGACIELYDLVSTTVSGIPMKEEAQKGQSVNYDVELLHSKTAHKQLQRLGLVGETGFLKDPNSTYYPTFRLCWATPSPRQAWNLFPRTRTPFAVTPCSVNSRPSVCLTSFLMNGRTVMLEVARKGPAQDLKPNVNQKLISHTLVSHAGRVYIHSIDIEKIALLDEPSTDELDDVLSLPDSISCKSDCDSESEEASDPTTFSFKSAKTANEGEINDEMELDSTSKRSSPLNRGGDSNDGFSRTSIEEASDFEDSSDSEDEQIIYSSSTMIDKYCDTINEQSTPRVEEICQLIKNHMLRPAKPEDLIPENNPPCYQPLRNIRRSTRYWPLDVEGSIIFNMQKTTKVSTIMSLYQKLSISADDIQELKKMLTQLIDLREREVELVEPSWKAYTKRNLSPSEQFRETLSELCMYMSNFVNNSSSHLEIFDFFQNLTKTDGIKISSDDVSLDDLNESSNTPCVHSAGNTSPPSSKKQRLSWKQNEVIKLGDLFNNQNAHRFKPHSKEFEGRVEFGHRTAQLYKGLDLTTAAPRGEADRQ